MALIDIIKAANLDRQAPLLKKKYNFMRQDAFLFFRCTPELYFSHIAEDSFLFNAPHAWICGDLHLENFGSYKGENRKVYFDINDFDNATMGSVLLDVARMATSMLVSAKTLDISPDMAQLLVDEYLRAYALHLSQGNIRMVTEDTSPSPVSKLLNKARPKSRKEFMENMIDDSLSIPKIKRDKAKYIEFPLSMETVLMEQLKKWASAQNNPTFFAPLDICQRISGGKGSLGLLRFLVLIHGEEETDGLRLLDIKETRPSCVPNAIPLHSTETRAGKVVQICKRMVAAPPAHLNEFHFGDKTYVVREFRGGDDNLSLFELKKDPRLPKMVARLLGELTAWDHLRGSGKMNAANGDILMEFGAAFHQWGADVIAFAKEAADQVFSDYTAYSQAYDAQEFDV